MDHVAFASEPEAGTIVHLVKAIELLPVGALARLRSDRSERHEAAWQG